MRSILVKIIFVVLVISNFQCKEKCENKFNKEIFDSKDAKSKEYQTAIQSLLKENKVNDVSYYFWSLEKIKNEDYMMVKCKADSLCAFLLLKINNNWEKLEQVKKVNGNGYQHAELKGLKWDIVVSDSIQYFYYKSLDRIID